IPRPPMARLGAPAPWARLPAAARRPTLADVRRVCATLPAPRRPRGEVPGMRGAAVLVALFEEDGAARVILTKRPDTMPSHRGDVAFPGGTRQPGDASLADAALREAEEEIGLPPTEVTLLGELDTLSTVTSRFLVAPFLGALSGRPVLVADPTEVVRIFDVSLADLLADGVHREEHWGLGSVSRPVHFFDVAGETVWGVTARILADFLTLLTAGRYPPALGRREE
ncbi:MAG: NUDIX hydrolase, partial [Acidimicrobiia bacterium]